MSFANLDFTYEELVEYAEKQDYYSTKIREAKNYYQRLSALREMYLDWVLPNHKGKYCEHLGHTIDWLIYLTPLEFKVYCDLRYFALAMYPQFPVLNYFIDFADPYRKVGIEVDSKEFHKDKKKDLKRHLELEKDGWTIYHISSYNCYAFEDEFLALGDGRNEDEDESQLDFEVRRDKILINCSSGIICCIKRAYYPERSNMEVAYTPSIKYCKYILDEVHQNFIDSCNG